jgi:hypothetical protein
VNNFPHASKLVSDLVPFPGCECPPSPCALPPKRPERGEERETPPEARSRRAECEAPGAQTTAAVARTQACLHYASRRGRWLFLPGVILLWPALLTLPIISPPSVDQSWQVSIGYFHEKNLKIGTDYIWTTGPLGFLYTSEDWPGLRHERYLFELVIKLAMAGWFVWLAGRLGWATILPWVCLLVLFSSNDSYPLFVTDGLYGFFVLVLGTFLIERDNPVRWRAAAAGMLGILALIKFTLFLLASGILLIVLVHHWRRGMGRLGALLIAAALAGFLGGWLGAGQPIGNVPIYIQRSLEIALGYGESMALPGRAEQLWLAGGIFLSLAVAVLAIRRTSQAQALVAMLVLVLFLEWKHGFTRHDAHSLSFFTCMCLLPFLAWGQCRREGWRLYPGAVSLALAGALGIAGIASSARYSRNPDDWFAEAITRYRERLHYLFFPTEYFSQLDRMAQSARCHADWPTFRRLVGTGTVDAISSSQSDLLSNHLTYRPRPVFQSYSAYTPGLLRLNGSAIASPEGPDFLVARLEPIDDHLPMLEDSAAWQQVFQHYRPVTVEVGNLLLARDRSRDSLASLPPEEILLERMVRFNEEVRVPVPEFCALPHSAPLLEALRTLIPSPPVSGGEGRVREGPRELERAQAPGKTAKFQKLALDFRPTWRGRLRSFLLRPPRLFIHLKLSDGRERRFRVVPALAKSGFLLNPFIGNCDDILKVYDRPGIARVVSFRLLIADDPAAMNEYIGLRLSSVPNLVAYKPARPNAGRNSDRSAAASPDMALGSGSLAASSGRR